MQLSVRSALSQEEIADAPFWRASGLVSRSKDPIADFRFAKSPPGSDQSRRQGRSEPR